MKTQTFKSIIMLVCITVSMAFVPVTSAAQDHVSGSRISEITVSVGWNIGSYKESTYARIIQKISDPKFHIGALFRRNNFLHTIKLDYMMAEPDSVLNETAVIYLDYDPVTGKPYYTPVIIPCFAHRASIEYSMLYSLSSKPDAVFSFGGAFRTDAYIQLSNYPSVTGIFSLGPSVHQSLRLSSRDVFEFQGGIPLIGWAVRPSYAGADALLMKYAEESPLKILTLGKLVSLHNYQAVFGSVDYKHSVNDLITLKLGSDIEYSRMAVPAGRPRYDLSLNLRSGVLFAF
jgi:hypothetical protein